MTDAIPFGEEQRIPINLEAEQALLGILMYENDSFHDIADQLRGFDFYEPYHQRMFDAIGMAIRTGRVAEPTYLKDFFEGDPSFEEMGGADYFRKLVNHAPPARRAKHYAEIITDQALRRYLITAADQARASAYDTSETALDLVLMAERSMGEVSMNGPQASAFSNIGDIYSRQFAQSRNNDGAPPGISTGIPDLDAKLGGLRKRNLILIGGRPGMGKSALAVQLAVNVAMPSPSAPKGRGVGFFSVEMPEEQVAPRFGCAIAFERDIDARLNPTFEAFEKGELTEAQWAKLDAAGRKLASMPIEIDFRSGLKVSQMLSAARRLKRKWAREGIEPGCIIIDHFGMISPEQRSKDKVVEASQIADAVLDMAKVLDMPVILLCQLSRDIDKRDDKRPNLSDLKWSGSLEENAAAVIFCFRPEYYNKPPKPDAKEAEWAKYNKNKELFEDRLFLLLEKNRNGRANQSIKTFCSIGHNAIQQLGEAFAQRAIDFSTSRLDQDEEDAIHELGAGGYD